MSFGSRLSLLAVLLGETCPISVGDPPHKNILDYKSYLDLLIGLCIVIVLLYEYEVQSDSC
jgi:hypothetical protein